MGNSIKNCNISWLFLISKLTYIFEILKPKSGRSLSFINFRNFEKLLVFILCFRERLARVWDHLEIVDLLDSEDATNLALLTRPELGITFTKIHCWNLTQYRKCVFLDADTLVIQNCDELFERDELSAVPDIGWPDCFNSGVFVFEPSRATYEAILEYAIQNGSFDGKLIKTGQAGSIKD